MLLMVGADGNYLTDVLPGDPRLRPRPLGDGRAADRDRARLGRGAPRRHRLRRQQRRLPGRGSAGDRRARRRDLRLLRLGPRRQPRRAAARPCGRAQPSPTRRPSRSPSPTPAGCHRLRRARARHCLRRRLDLGLPPRHRHRRHPDDRRRHRLRLRHREPAPSNRSSSKPRLCPAGECGHGADADCAPEPATEPASSGTEEGCLSNGRILKVPASLGRHLDGREAPLLRPLN